MTRRTLHLRDGDLVIRTMRDEPAEYERMVLWRNRPHVRAWWDPDLGPSTLEDVLDEYRDDVLGGTETTPCIVEVSGVSVGFVQLYPWSDCEPELEETGMIVPDGAWGIDLFIGEPDSLRRGIGRRAIRLVSDHLIRAFGATAVALGVEKTNVRAQRAYVAAGMTPSGEYLDLDTRGGERVPCILMIRSAGADS